VARQQTLLCITRPASPSRCRQILFRLRDMPPGESEGEGLRGSAGNSLVALVREVDSSKEHRLLATEAGVITSGTLSALRQMRVRAGVSG
jgi:hypothetical protein